MKPITDEEVVQRAYEWYSYFLRRKEPTGSAMQDLEALSRYIVKNDFMRTSFKLRYWAIGFVCGFIPFIGTLFF